jgi:uncharacterized membrane protein YccC
MTKPFVAPAVLRSAIRFAVALAAADAIGLAVFGSGARVLFCSFAAVSLAFFCDFDGSASERLVSNLAATAIGLGGLALGGLVAPSVPVSVLATFIVGFGFSFARVFRGFVARSAVGLQLAFLLAVVLPSSSHQLASCVASWALGCAVTTVVLMVLLPRHHSGQVRRGLSDWCRAAERLVRVGADSGQAAAVLAELRSDMDHLIDLSLGMQEWPGSFSPHKRALNSMFVTAESATTGFERSGSSALGPDDHGGDLATATAEAFHRAGELVELRDGAGPDLVVGLEDQRTLDLAATELWTAELLRGSPTNAVSALARHHALRVMSIVADVMWRLSLISRGSSAEEPELGTSYDEAVLRLVKSNLTFRSIWFRNGLRAGFGTAAAVLVARETGVAHGFWVVLAALALINVTFTGDGARSFAAQAVAGTTLGVLGGIALVALRPGFLAFLILVPVVAFLTKVVVDRGIIWLQAMFSLFVIVNTSLLGWPPSIRTATVRLTDVLLGLGVAVLVTLVIFPRGLRRFLARSSSEAVAAVDLLMNEGLELLVSPAADRERFRRSRVRCVEQVQRFEGALEAVFHAVSTRSPNLVRYKRAESWMRQGLIAAEVFESLHGLEGAAIDDPALVSAMAKDVGERIAAIDAWARQHAASLAETPHRLICAVWASLWMDQLDTDRPRGLGSEA